jgi:Ca2+-binding RTX toxin-like protein
MFRIENLERRELLSTAVDNTLTFTAPAGGSISGLQPIQSVANTQAHVSKSGTLLVEGTTGNDTIRVSTSQPLAGTTVIPAYGNAVSVTRLASGKVTAESGTVQTAANGKLVDAANALYVSITSNGQTANYFFDRSTVKRISIEGGAGNDYISIGPDVKLKAMILGGKGDDTLVGGILGDTISGGDGNDVIYAGPNEAIVYTSAAPVQQVTPPPVGGKLFVPGAKTTTPLTGVVNLVSVSERADSADLLEGGKGDDTITSGQGPDTVIGGAGNDSLRAMGRTGKHGDLSSDTAVDFDGLTVSTIEGELFSTTPISSSTGVVYAIGTASKNVVVGTTLIGG